MTVFEQSQLVKKAKEAAKNAYAPYSNFRVGAALLAADGRSILAGCNVENASFGLTICAERAALACAIAAGFRKFKAIVISVPGRKAALPCGACLQALAEFCGPDFPVLAVASARPDVINVFKLGDLLPHAFRLK